MSIYCLTDVMKHSESTGGARLVLFVLAEHAHDDGAECYPAVERIGSASRMSRRGVQGALRKLEEIGEIERDGIGPRGQTRWKITAKARGADPSPPADRDAEGRTSQRAEGAPGAPEPSIEPSGTRAGRNARAKTDEIPADFPDELRPHARAAMRVLLDVAKARNAKAISAAGLASVISARPRKPIVRAAHDCAAWIYDHPSTPCRDVLARYRRWLDREEDLASLEVLPGEGPPVAENVTRLRPNATEAERRRARQEERARRASGAPHRTDTDGSWSDCVGGCDTRPGGGVWHAKGCPHFGEGHERKALGS